MEDYRSKVYTALKSELGDSFTKTPEEFNAAMDTDKEYSAKVYAALKGELGDSFDKTPEQFFSLVKKKEESVVGVGESGDSRFLSSTPDRELSESGEVGTLQKPLKTESEKYAEKEKSEMLAGVTSDTERQKLSTAIDRTNDFFKGIGGKTPYQKMQEFNSRLSELNKKINPSSFASMSSEDLAKVEMQYKQDAINIASQLGLEVGQDGNIRPPKNEMDAYTAKLGDNISAIETEKQKEKGFFSNLASSLAAGYSSASGATLDLLGTLSGLNYFDAYRDLATGDRFNAETFKQQANKYDKNIEQYTRSGDLDKAAGLAITSAVESLPYMIPALINPEYGVYVMGGMSGIDKYRELEESKIPEWEKVYNAVSSGTFEAIFEKLGTGAILSRSKRAILELGEKRGKDAIVNAVTKTVENSASKIGRMPEWVKEGISEVATGVGQDITDKVTVNPEKKIGENSFDNFTVGAVMGKVFALPQDVAKGMDRLAARDFAKKVVDKLPADMDIETKIALGWKIAERDKLVEAENKLDEKFKGKYATQIVTLNTEIDEIANKYLGKTKGEEVPELSVGKMQEDGGEQQKLDYLKEKGVEVPDGTTTEQLNTLFEEQKQKEQKPEQKQKEEVVSVAAEQVSKTAPKEEAIKPTEAISEPVEPPSPQEAPIVSPEQKEGLKQTKQESVVGGDKTLLGTTKKLWQKKSYASATKKDGVVLVPIEELDQVKDQDRETQPKWGEEDTTLDELTNQIKEDGGIKTPIQVDVFEDGSIITEGNTRLAAAKRLGIEKIPVVFNRRFKSTSGTIYEGKVKNIEFTKEETPSKIDIKNAIDNGLFNKSIEVGEMTQQDVVSIIESAGLKVPEEIKQNISLQEQITEVKQVKQQENGKETSDEAQGRKEGRKEKLLTEQEEKKVAETSGVKPKNLRDVYTAGREIFGLNKVQALAQAIIVDRVVAKAAKNSGKTKQQIYSEIEFRKEDELLRSKVNTYFQAAWHGSPYQFDKFTTEKIGTGEGVQAFGWGLYFTDLKSIAEGYAKTLSSEKIEYAFNGKQKDIFIKENDLNSDDVLQLNIALDRAFDVSTNSFSNQKFERYINNLKTNTVIVGEKLANSAKKLKNIFNGSIDITQSSKTPNLYKVELHKGKTTEQYDWLVWDKKVDNNTVNKIIKSLNAIGKTSATEIGSQSWADLGIVGGIDGNSLYEKLSNILNGDKQASLFLLENGIDGIKYPAESIARGATSDTARGFNYVVFDENAVTIEEVIKFQNKLQGKRGAMAIHDGKSLIYALTDPNVSTPLHEIAHVYERYMLPSEKAAVLAWTGHKTWSVETSEKFARGFERYLAEGVAPTEKLKAVFERFKTWLTDIYNGIKQSEIDVELNTEMKRLYDSILTGKKYAPSKEEVATKAQEVPKKTYKDVDDLLFQSEDVKFQDTDKTERHTKALENLISHLESEKSKDVAKEVNDYLKAKGNPISQELIDKVLKERGYATRARTTTEEAGQQAQGVVEGEKGQIRLGDNAKTWASKEKIKTNNVLQEYLDKWAKDVIGDKGLIKKEIKEDFDLFLTKLRNLNIIETDCG